jgi:ankyrin repeat protein
MFIRINPEFLSITKENISEMTYQLISALEHGSPTKIKTFLEQTCPGANFDIEFAQRIIDNKTNVVNDPQIQASVIHELITIAEMLAIQDVDYTPIAAIIRELITVNPALLNEKDITGDNPLMLAGGSQLPIIVKTLLDLGANPNCYSAQDKEKSLLNEALNKAETSEAIQHILKDLLSHSDILITANLYKRLKELVITAVTERNPRLSENQAKMLDILGGEALLKRFDDQFLRDLVDDQSLPANNETRIIISDFLKGHLEIGRMLTAAADRNDENEVKVLLAKNVWVNVRNKEGGSVLMWAAKYGYTETTAKLIELGADINAKNNKTRELIKSFQSTKNKLDSAIIERIKNASTDFSKEKNLNREQTLNIFNKNKLTKLTDPNMIEELGKLFKDSDVETIAGKIKNTNFYRERITYKARKEIDKDTPSRGR